MRERRIGLAVIVLLLLALGAQHAPRVHLSTIERAGHDAVQVEAAIDLGARAGAILFTWTIEHLQQSR